MGYQNALLKDVQTQRLVTLTSLGTLIHWYDFYILAQILPLLFKHQILVSQQYFYIIGLVATTIGFFIRPLGAIFFGNQIDTIGRKVYFARSLTLIAASSALVALTPFQFIPTSLGIFILVACRILQGFALSMEYSASVSYIYESVPESKTGFFTALLQTMAPLGFLGALLMVLIFKNLFGEVAFQDWGWRLVLLLGLPLLLLAQKVRKDLPESPEFSILKKRQELSKNPLKDLFASKNSLKIFLIALFAIAAPQGATFYLAHVFGSQYLQQTWQLSTEIQSFATILIIGLLWPITLIVGRLADRINQIHLFSMFLMFAIVFIPFCFYWLELLRGMTTSYWLALIPLGCVYAISIGLYGVTAVNLAKLFPTKHRGIGVGLPYHIGNGIFGGLVTVMSGTQELAAGKTWVPVLYTSTLCIIALITIYFSKEDLNF
ncbi:MAG: MFS transporter [Bdellovibrionia bacterium]